jgi:hypothetical protein
MVRARGILFSVVTLACACARQSDEPRRNGPNIVLADPAKSVRSVPMPHHEVAPRPAREERIRTEDDYLRDLMLADEEAGADAQASTR